MSGLAIELKNVSVIGIPSTPKASDFCPCDFWCEWKEKVFADPSSSDTWKRDHSDFLFRKVTAADTLTIDLYKGDAIVATIVDSTYGTYYGFGTFAVQPLYLGWVADWSLIYTAFSGGVYQVKVSGTIAGAAFSFDSRKFQLRLWNEEDADGTVKIESYQDGNIMSSDFDFTDLLTNGWYSSIRLPARFGKRTPILEVDEYLNTSYQSVQNQTKVKHEYTLETKYVPKSVLNSLSDKDLIGNTLVLTDYSLMSGTKYDQIPVVAKDFTDIGHNEWYNGQARYTITFEERVQDTIKRNF